MKRTLYLNTNGRLQRKESTIYYITAEGRRIVPVEQVHAVVMVGRVSITSGVISYFAKLGIPIHYFGFYGNYEGSFYPRKKLVSGFALINQARAYLDDATRLYLAQEFIRACLNNMKFSLRHHAENNEEIGHQLRQIEGAIEEISGTRRISELMNIEARGWIHYYASLDLAIPEFSMGTRQKRPPSNPINALISFGNSLLYTAILTQIYHTQLDPSISYLHEPSSRRFSLALDIAEVFKPTYVGSLILRLLNKRILQVEHFDQRVNNCTLTDSGRQQFLAAFDESLRQTSKHPKLRRSVSNEFLLRLECYKILKHVVEGKRFIPYLASRGY